MYGRLISDKLNEIAEELVCDRIPAQVLDDAELGHDTASLTQRNQGQIGSPPCLAGT